VPVILAFFVSSEIPGPSSYLPHDQKIIAVVATIVKIIANFFISKNLI